MNLTVTIKIAWWFKYIIIPTAKFMLWMGIEVDMNVINKLIEKAVKIKLPKVKKCQ